MIKTVELDINTLDYWKHQFSKMNIMLPTLDSLIIPEQPQCNEPTKLIVVPAGVTAASFIRKWKDVSIVIKDGLNIDEVFDARVVTKSYAGWVVDMLEPTDEFLNEAVRVCDPERAIGITLLEHLISMHEYGTRHPGKQLDSRCVTVCSGSRFKDGSIPTVCFNAATKEIYIRSFSRAMKAPFFGIRQFFK